MSAMLLGLAAALATLGAAAMVIGLLAHDRDAAPAADCAPLWASGAWMVIAAAAIAVGAVVARLAA